MSPTDPYRRTLAWLSTHARFPASRLQPHAEALVCLVELAAAASAPPPMRFLVQSRDGARDAALRAHKHRRSFAHDVCDNRTAV
jgi:hypothetical protein